MRVGDLFRFMELRHAIYHFRAQGAPRPWTGDPILQQYRFCNVFRELDTETQWIAKNWREPNSAHEDLWFAMMVARLFNWHETLSAIKLPLPFTKEYQRNMRRALFGRMNRGEKVWTGAYMVSTNGKEVPYKHEYVIENVLKPAWERRHEIRPRTEDTLASFYERLLMLEGMGAFMAGQVIADVKYAKEGALYLADDWHSWAVMGPGSRRGMNRMNRLPPRGAMREDTWQAHMQVLVPKIQERVAQSSIFVKSGFPTIHAQDVQNCLCEFDKYERVRLGEGVPRSRYNGGE